MCDAFLETEILRFETNSSPRLPFLPFYPFTFLPFYLFTILLFPLQLSPVPWQHLGRSV